MEYTNDEPEWITIEMSFRGVNRNDVEDAMDDLKDHMTDYIKKYKFADKLTALDVR